MSDKSKADKLEYAVELIESASEKVRAPMSIVSIALTVMEFGGISPKEMLYYLEAVGKEK